VANVATSLGSDPANNFVLGAFVDCALVGTAGGARSGGLRLLIPGARLVQG
jgi:hypothetical protein